LIQKGANVNAANAFGFTPLHVAKTRHVTETLLEHGANIHALRHGRIPLKDACYGGRTEVIRTLYAHGSRLPSERYKELDKVIALYAGMCWKRSRVGGLSSHILISYMV
jgi:ankyrin repeat protein